MVSSSAVHVGGLSNTVADLNDLLTDPFGQYHPLMLAGQLQLIAWTLSGTDTQLKAFQQKLHKCCSLDGAGVPTQHTKVPGKGGSAGVCHRKWIPFRVLSTHSLIS